MDLNSNMTIYCKDTLKVLGQQCRHEWIARQWSSLQSANWLAVEFVRLFFSANFSQEQNLACQTHWDALICTNKHQLRGLLCLFFIYLSFFCFLLFFLIFYILHKMVRMPSLIAVLANLNITCYYRVILEPYLLVGFHQRQVRFLKSKIFKMTYLPSYY